MSTGSSQRLTSLQARHIALKAQGLSTARPASRITGSHLRRTLGRLGFYQIDSVNVLQRAHLVPLYSRMGPYDLDIFHRAAGRSPRAMFEYWAHMATYVDVQLWAAMAHRMAQMRQRNGWLNSIQQEYPDFVRAVFDVVAASGPMSAREVDAVAGMGVERDRSQWGWNWTLTKQALEYLFFVGELTSAQRNAQFERMYDLPERVLPAAVLAQAPLDSEQAHRVLVEHAARAHGIGTEPCLRDYFRTAPAPTRRAVEDLIAEEVLLPVRVDGWDRPAYRHRDASLPRVTVARALLSPFDPLVFERKRTEQLFGFRYRIEIYLPERKGEYGYYVLPFLLGDSLVARVDLKADRRRGVLVVKGAWAEPDAPAETVEELAAELRLMAQWLDLSEIAVGRSGDLAALLSQEIQSGA